MSETLGVGLFLPNSAEHLEKIRSLLPLADFFEISPETFWTGAMGDHPGVAALAVDRPFVAHGLGYSMGTPWADEGPEQQRTSAWLAKIREFHERFQFCWYTDHLGFSSTLEGWQNVMPLPLPHTWEAVRTVRQRLSRLAEIVPTVGFENSVFYFTLGPAEQEADFYNALTADGSCHLLLDLHNVHTHCLNFGLDPAEFLRRIDTTKVIEIHLSGGDESEPDWLESGRRMRLDSHDGPIPAPVWKLYEMALDLCPNLRGVAVERLDGTLGDDEMELFRQELERARAMWERRRPRTCGGRTPVLEEGESLSGLQRDLSAKLWAGGAYPVHHTDGWELSHLLIRHLRLGRILRGDPALRAKFHRDPPAFLERLQVYFKEVDPQYYFPDQEAARFEEWLSTR